MGTDAKPAEYCILWIDHWSTCMTKAEWSGWVQAIGAIVAIAAGVLVVWWQLHRQQQQAYADEIRRLQIISISAFFVAVSLTVFIRGARLGKFNEVEQNEIQTRMKAFAAIPLLDVPQVDVSRAIGSAVSAFFLFDQALAPYGKFLGTDFSKYEGWDKERCSEAEKWANVLLLEVEPLEVTAGIALEMRAASYPTYNHQIDGQDIYPYPRK